MPQGMEWMYGLDPMTQALLMSGALGPSTVPQGFGFGGGMPPGLQGPFQGMPGGAPGPGASMGGLPGMGLGGALPGGLGGAPPMSQGFGMGAPPNPLSGIASMGVSPSALSQGMAPNFSGFPVQTGGSSVRTFADTKAGGSHKLVPDPSNPPAATQVAPTGSGGASLMRRGRGVPNVNTDIQWQERMPWDLWQREMSRPDNSMFDLAQQPFQDAARAEGHEEYRGDKTVRPNPMTEHPVSAGLGLALSNIGGAIAGNPDIGRGTYQALERGQREHYDEAERLRERMDRFEENKAQRMADYTRAGLTTASQFMTEMTKELSDKGYQKHRDEIAFGLRKAEMANQLEYARIVSGGKDGSDKQKEQMDQVAAGMNMITDLATQYMSQKKAGVRPKDFVGKVIISRSGQPIPQDLHGQDEALLRLRSNIATLDPEVQNLLNAYINEVLVKPFEEGYKPPTPDMMKQAQEWWEKTVAPGLKKLDIPLTRTQRERREKK
jgi:hypothetical protein